MSAFLTPHPTPTVPPFTLESATRKVRAAEDAWNSRDPDRVSLAYSLDSQWRNRAEFVQGRQQIKAFLRGKWEREQDYRLIKEMWAFTGNRIAVQGARATPFVLKRGKSCPVVTCSLPRHSP